MSTLMADQIDVNQIQTLFSKEDLAKRIKEVASSISEDYKKEGVESIIVVGVLKGALLFTADLIRELDIPVQLEFIRLSSYKGTTSSGLIRTYDLSLPNITQNNILIIEDIVDSGRTAQFLLNFFNNQTEAKSVKLVSLLDKPCKRLDEYKEIDPDYSCFTVDDKFVVGYGLDFDQHFRDLPYIGYIEA